MFNATMAEYSSADYVVSAAAVSDYRPSEVSGNKLKKEIGLSEIRVVQTEDILAELGRRKTKQILVGFAAETEDVEANARKKLTFKNLDWIVANDVTAEGAGFEVDTNIVQIYGKNGETHALPLGSKLEIAESLWKIILARQTV
jgi:phosphopantothenoylcysteine decarboxylase/phosphopantothenate--cysteine ligase